MASNPLHRHPREHKKCLCIEGLASAGKAFIVGMIFVPRHGHGCNHLAFSSVHRLFLCRSPIRTCSSVIIAFCNTMAKRLHDSPKIKRHFTLTDTAFTHLSDIAKTAQLSRSETLERLIRSTAQWEGDALFSDGAWPFAIDHSQSTVPADSADESF